MKIKYKNDIWKEKKIRAYTIWKEVSVIKI